MQHWIKDEVLQSLISRLGELVIRDAAFDSWLTLLMDNLSYPSGMFGIVGNTLLLL